MASLKFPFETYLSHDHDLPDYDHEWNIIIIKIVLTTFTFLVIIPTILKSLFRQSSKQKDTVVVEVPLNALIPINVIFITIIFSILAFSPNNITTARRVYQAPLLNPAECQRIIDMGHRAAERKVQKATHELNLNLNSNDKEEYEKILKFPIGWGKDRHTSYPTTDLNVVVDFEKEDLDYIEKTLNARLSPLLARIYGISQDSIRAYDMFIVRYDGEDVGEGGQQGLTPHTDHSHLSFNILLNDEFSGGGTRFYNRFQGVFYDAKPKPGDVLINNGMVTHEGLATTKGEWKILLMGCDHIWMFKYLLRFAISKIIFVSFCRN